MRAWLIVCLLLALLAGACGESSRPPARAPDPLSGLLREARRLDRATLAEEGVAPREPRVLIERTGFDHAWEEEYVGRNDTYAHVLSRRLVFDDARGAAAYLRWLQARVRAILGRIDRARSLPLGTSGMLYRERNRCRCEGDFLSFVAAWREATTVRLLIADGPGLDEPRFRSLAQTLPAP